MTESLGWRRAEAILRIAYWLVKVAFWLVAINKLLILA